MKVVFTKCFIEVKWMRDFHELQVEDNNMEPGVEVKPALYKE